MAQTPESALKHIAEIETSDREAAREAVAQGVQSAKEKWIEAPLIVEALALELISVAQISHSNSMMAAYLRNLAEAMEAPANRH
ncbi:MAG: hypothetical protein KUG72_00250 [Pseudomonadales bacterium]|nr:hypothetical protein [Pseudomonadales bacterium]